MELVEEAADNEQLSFLGLGAGPWHHCALEVWQEALWAILLRAGHLERASPTLVKTLITWSLSSALNKL